jgi:hypothetical protein
MFNDDEVLRAMLTGAIKGVFIVIVAFCFLALLWWMALVILAP